MVSDRYSLPILGAVILCTVPHFPYLSPWVPLAALFLWTYTLLAARYSWRLPAKPVFIVLSAVFFVASMFTHEGFTIEAFIALLALLAGMKVLEIRSQRDRIVTVILCYFLIVGGMFFSDSVWASTYKFFAILCTTGVLIYINFPGQTKTGSLKISFSIMVQAVPLMIILFLFFPRIQGGIWGRTHLNLARTGFNDELSFGSVARLAQNTDIAFRVEFNGAVPPQHMLYWRGVVLWTFDGREWKRKMEHRSRAPDFLQASNKVSYTVTLEPHNEHWLFALDWPADIDLRRARLLYDFIGYRWRPITSRVTYAAESYLQTRVPLHDYYQERALQLPQEGNPRSRSLAKSLMEQSDNDADFVRRVLEYFQDNSFQYTFTPPQLTTGAANGIDDNDLMDRFLFESRKGFCEHFAGAFAFLMRAAGVPTRIVLGYQGGTLNEYGNYLIVRQSNAHSWCEVWLEEKGWTRIDPTGIVAPERLTAEGSAALLPGITGTFLTLRELGLVGSLLGDLGKRFDYYNNLWNRWVMTYSINNQIRFFGNLGIRVTNSEGLGKALLVFLVSAILIITLINLFLYIGSARKESQVSEAWNEFCRKLARVDLPRRPGQGPVDYLEHVCGHRHDLTKQVQDIVSSYIKIQYGRDASEVAISNLQSMVKKFSPGKAKK